MRFLLLLSMLVAGPSLSFGANIVQNPGFEDQVFGPWVSNGHPWGIDTANAHTGKQSAGTGCIGAVCIAADPDPLGAWIYQDLATSAGTSYTLSFWIGLRGINGGTTPNEIKILWNGSQVFDIQNVTTIAFTPYTVNVQATGASTRLEFLGRNDPNVIDIDDVSVDAGAVGVPEPGSIVLMGIGIAGLLGMRRQRGVARRLL